MPFIVTMETKNTYPSFLKLFKELIMLEIDFVKLTLAEKVIILLSVLSLSFIALIIVICAMLFISIGVVKMLSMVVPDYLGYIIIGVFYILLLIVLLSLKRILIVDPISRLITKLILNKPK